MDDRNARATRRTTVVLLAIALIASAGAAGATVAGPDRGGDARSATLDDAATLRPGTADGAVAARESSVENGTDGDGSENGTDEGADPAGPDAAARLTSGSAENVEELDTVLPLEGGDGGDAIDVFPDGDYAIVGEYQDFETTYVARVNPDGSTEWVSDIGLPSPRDVATTPEGNVIAVGEAYNTSEPHLYGLTGDGEIRYRTAGYASDTTYQGVVVADGSAYVAGEFSGEAVVFEHPLGSGVYTAGYFSRTNGSFDDVVAVDGGLVAVGGDTEREPAEAFAVGLERDLGADPRWTARHGAGDPGFESLYAAAPTPGGDVVAVGFADESERDRDWDVYLARIDDEDGDAVWTDRYGSPAEDWGLDVVRVGSRLVALSYPGALVDDGRTAKAHLVDPDDGSRQLVTRGANEGDWFWEGVGVGGDRLVTTGEERPAGSGDFGGESATLVLRNRFTAGNADVALGSATVAQGTRTTLPLTADGDGIAGYSATLEFDPGVMRVVEVRDGDLGGPVTNVDNAAGTITLSAAQATGVDDPTLAEVVVEATGEPGEETGVRFVESGTTLSTASGQLNVGTYGDGGLAIRDCLPGDANADASVTPLDATQILRYVSDLSTVDAFDPGCADYNRDGAVSPFDATQVLREVAGLSTVSTTATASTSAGTRTATTTAASGTLAVGSATADPGETVTVDLVAAGEDVAGFGATVRFDPDVVTVTDVEGGDLGTPVVNVDNEAGTATLSGAQATGVDDPTLATLALEVAGDAEPGTSVPLALSPEEASLSTTTETLSVDVEDGSVTVSDDTEPSVTIADATLDPATVGDDRTVTHTLRLGVAGISDDGNTDTFAVEFPDAVESIDTDSVRVADADGDSVSITGADVSGRTYTFSVAPDSAAETRELIATLDVEASYRDVDANTTAQVTASVSDSAHGSDSVGIDLAVRDGASSRENDRFEPNDGPETATSISPGTYEGLAATPDDTDAFLVDLNEGDSLEAAIEFDHAASNLDLAVYYQAERGGDIQELRRSGSETDDERIDLGAVERDGIYHVVVFNSGDEYAEYTLRIRSDGDGDGSCPTVGGSDAPATDPDGDGVCEDTNGDGVVVPGDATVLFDAVFEGSVASDAARFDMNGDGAVTAGDATVLFDEAFAASDAPPATDGTATALVLEPDDASVVSGESVTYRITAIDVADGIGAYDLSVSVDDPSTATITGASNAIGGQDRVEIAGDGSAVQLGAFAGDTADAGSEVVLATVTVTGESAGEATLSVEPTSISDETGTDRYRIEDTEPATLSVGVTDGTPIEVAVYSQTGGALPRSSTSGNPVLAGEVTNRLRIEVFPGPNAGRLDEPVTLALSGPTREVDAITRTADVDTMPDTELVTPGRSEGHVGFVQVTPTGTGTGVIRLHRGDTAGPVVTTVDGDEAVFDVLRSNRRLAVDTPATVAAGDTLSVTVTDRPTGDPVAGAEVVATAPDGTTTTARTAANGAALLDIGAAGTHELTVRRAGYATAESDFEAIDEGTGDGVAVTLRPGEPSVPTGGTATLDVVVNGTDAGVGGYELVVNSSDVSVATIVDVADRTGGTVRRSLAQDGSGARVGAFGGDTTDTGPVTIATVTVEGVAAGTVDAPLTVESLSDESGRQYTVDAATGATLSVSEAVGPPPVVGDARPTDPDGDGRYEDLNGDGSVTPGDATVLFNAVFAGDPAVTDNVAAFDFNGDDGVTPGDATVLFEEAFGN